ncbi:MAG: hypothetical protein H7235_08395, partial [Bdellovibrionaceae bacterium]|nr:hypothetical protein [Pseudobdellovibrionaceae bacterium]
MKKLNILKLTATLLFLAGCAKPAVQHDQIQESPTTETPAAAETPDETTVANRGLFNYRERYKVLDPFTKVVDNHGNGNMDLYGTRNFRAVLHGVYYRGGANNVYNKDGVRDNSNPLPNNGLDNLCKEGFSNAIYFYSTNYNSAPHQVSCRDRQDLNNTLQYKQINALAYSPS